jgi:hypothetical protein
MDILETRFFQVGQFDLHLLVMHVLSQAYGSKKSPLVAGLLSFCGKLLDYQKPRRNRGKETKEKYLLCIHLVRDFMWREY